MPLVITQHHPNEVVLMQHVAGDPEQVIETPEAARLCRWISLGSDNPEAYNEAFVAQWNRQLKQV